MAVREVKGCVGRGKERKGKERKGKEPKICEYILLKCLPKSKLYVFGVPAKNNIWKIKGIGKIF